MKPKRLLISLIFLTGCSLAACTSEQAPEPVTPSSCGSVDIKSARVYTIIQENCTNRSCHPGMGTPLVADFSTLAKLKSYIAANGTSWTLRVTGPNADMPQSQSFPPLSRATRDSIACWVSNGMPD